MLDEFTKALGPWPILQAFFGLIVVALGVYAMARGVIGRRNEPQVADEDKRAEWAAYEQLRNIEQNTFKIVDTQTRMVDAVNRLVDVVWNRRQ